LVSLRFHDSALLKGLSIHIKLNYWFLACREDIVSEAQEDYYYLTFYTGRHILAFYDYFSQDTAVDDDHRQLCQTLLNFVNPNAHLVSTGGIVKLDLERENYNEVLCSIGQRLSDIFSHVAVVIRGIPSGTIKEPVASDIARTGELFVAACNDKFRVPNIIMSLYANRGLYPESWQVFICRTTTTAEELTLFVKRCFFAPRNKYGEHLFCIANLEFLEFELQYNLVNDIRTLLNRGEPFNLALICCRENGIHHHILDQFSKHVVNTVGLEISSMKNMYEELCPNVKCVSSDLSGQGKTEYIKQTCMETTSIPRSVLISDGMRYDRLVSQLHECKLKRMESLHLNIVSVDNPAEVNTFIFEFLTLGIVSNKVNISSLPRQSVFIEIASTMEQYLLESLPIIKCLPRKHLTWDINRFIISSEIYNPIQVVCRYLDALMKGTVDDNDISFGHGGIQEPLPVMRCRELIQHYFFANNPATVASYRFVEIFINVLADQLVRLSLSSFFRVENLNLMSQNSKVRSTLLETLIYVSKDFATRSVASKAAQLASTAKDADKARLATIAQWDDSNHLLVFFLSQTPDSICALYRDRKKVPENVKRLLWSQKAQRESLKSFTLEDYHKMLPRTLQERLECIARTSMESKKFGDYALSADNLIKMALILLRARANIPVVVCGEAGCGKVILFCFANSCLFEYCIDVFDLIDKSNSLFGKSHWCPIP